MSMIPIEEKIYNDGRTKQAFKDSTDINKILKKAQTTGSLAHLQKYPEAVYGDFDGEFDLLTAQQRISRANEIFADLPSEVRREFDNNALRFVQYAGDPANNDKLRELLPALAKPGSFFPNPVNRGGDGAAAATAPPADPAPGNPPPVAEPVVSSPVSDGEG
ncbi:putative minor capsid protein [Eel River basin pequenovirus]|nr:putative minor capsid protein [Eel River basin pequenovirus]